MINPRFPKLLGYALALFGILVCWHLLALALGSPALPTPLETVPMLARYAGQLGPDFLISLYRVVVALLIGTVLAMPLGLIIGRSPRLDAVLGPVLYILYPIPKIVFLPILLVLLGIADAPKIVLIALTIFFQVLITVRDAAKEVPLASVLSVRSLGASRLDVFRHVVIPASLPELFTALRISSGTAVAILFFAEAIAGSTGLGAFIVDSWALLDYPRMFAGIIAMAFLGVVLYELFDILERRLARWR
ncbi:MAG: ABC transporter permease [Coriobacteriales bacterium]|jgi:NitT/TauT family transport system permease protein|nr:ABC transporter permease [Coriobacteriales bacterium]